MSPSSRHTTTTANHDVRMAEDRVDDVEVLAAPLAGRNEPSRQRT